MKIIKNLKFAALAALAALGVTLLFQTPTTLADDKGQRDEHGQQAKVTFTKWITAFPNLPGRIYDMAGVVGGAVGDGIFAGEVLFRGSVGGGVTRLVAFYHFTGPEHSFTALVNVEATGSTPGSTAVITGIVTDGWLKGHAVEGEYTVITCDHVGLSPNCFEGTLAIARDSRDSIDN